MKYMFENGQILLTEVVQMDIALALCIKHIHFHFQLNICLRTLSISHMEKEHLANSKQHYMNICTVLGLQCCRTAFTYKDVTLFPKYTQNEYYDLIFPVFQG